MSKPKWRLCYVEDFDSYGEAPLQLYFTPLPLEKQWGDDWGDAPYEHNAGEPYRYDYSQPEQGVRNGMGIYPEIHLKTIFIETSDWKQSLLTPRSGFNNSPYSVEDINSGVVPWVTIKRNGQPNIYIKAGTEYNSVIKQCLEIGLRVYTRKEKRK